MASRVVMPKLTDTMEEGVLVEWKKHEGDHVESGEVLAEIETDKAVMELEAFASGTLRKILVRIGETVPSGTLLGVIAEADEDITPALTEKVTATPSTGGGTKPASAASVSQPPAPPAHTGKARPLASPRAKALAAERGINLSAIAGTGPGGRIIEEDVAGARTPAIPALPAL